MKGHNQELDTRSVPREAKAPNLVSTNVVGAGEKLHTTQGETLGQQALRQSPLAFPNSGKASDH